MSSKVGIANLGIQSGIAKGRRIVRASKVFITVKRAPGATFLGKRVRASRANCVGIMPKAARAGVPNIFTYNSMRSGGCHRTVATTKAKYVSTLSTRQCLRKAPARS